MTDDISLLPSDLRGKEGEEKKKAKEASAKPQFKMHVPEAQKKNGNGSASASEPDIEIPDIEIGETSALKKENQGEFRILKKEEGAVEKDGSGRDVILEEAEENRRASAPEVNLMIKRFFESKKHHTLFKVMIVVVGVVLILTIALIVAFYFPQFVKK